MTTQITGIHPYADKFPMIPEAELAELAESIKANGLRYPIVVTPDGLILDGRNRYAACTRADVDPTVEVYDGDDLAEYVIDANSSRRHMSTGARAMSTALVLAADGRRRDGRWRRGSVIGNPESGTIAEAKTWQNSLNAAGLILDHAPDLADAVVSGELALDAARRQAEERRDAERRKLEEAERTAAEEADAKAFIEERDPELAARVDGTDLRTYAEARDLWKRRNAEEARALREAQKAQEEQERKARAARSHTYTTIATALQTLGAHGIHDDAALVMAEFNPAELNPPQMIRHFSDENLDRVIDFATQLKEWMAQR